MTVTDSRPATHRQASPALVLAVTPTGVVVPSYDQKPAISLDLRGLRVIEALACGGYVPADDGDGDVDGGGLLDVLRERGLVAEPSERDERPIGADVADVVVSDADRSRATDELVLVSPVLVRTGPRGFEFLDHEGGVLQRLSAVELMAAASYREPAVTSAADERQRAEMGPDALDSTSFEALTQRLRVAGLLVAFDPDDPAHANRTRQTEILHDGIRRHMQVLAEFDRLEDEHDLVQGATDRVRVIGYHDHWAQVPASLGMVLASARGYEDGALFGYYDFRPRLLWDRTRVEQAAAGPAAVFLFSDYVWSSAGNLAMSSLVKDVNPHHLVVHGGPDAPKYDADVERYFADHPAVDVIVHGEGEASFPEMLAALRGHIGDGHPDLSVLREVAGLSFRLDGRVERTGTHDRIAELDVIPSPVLMGLFEGFIPAGHEAALTLESNRGCPYGCTFCDWGSATLSRIRKFDIDRTFAELACCAERGWKIGLADANFGIFERDVAIAERIAELKAIHGAPRFVGINYAKNSVKHLARIIEIFTEAGIVAEGKMSMQSFDEDTLLTIHRKNIKVEKYNDLSAEFRRNDLPLSVDIMMGLPGSTLDTFRSDLQNCISRDVRSIIQTTVLLPNSPMNEPAYRAEHGIVALPGEEVRESATFTRAEWDEMHDLMWAFWLFENFAVLRQVATYVHAETGMREIDFYDQLIRDMRAEPGRWPSVTVTLRVLPQMMVPPVSWRWFIDDIRRYVVDHTEVPADDALETVLRVQHALLPARDRSFPSTLDLAHDYAAWHAAVADARDRGHHDDWHEQVPPLRTYDAGSFIVDDSLNACQAALGEPTFVVAMKGISNWDLDSPVSRPHPVDPAAALPVSSSASSQETR